MSGTATIHDKRRPYHDNPRPTANDSSATSTGDTPRRTARPVDRMVPARSDPLDPYRLGASRPPPLGKTTPLVKVGALETKRPHDYERVGKLAAYVPAGIPSPTNDEAQRAARAPSGVSARAEPRLSAEERFERNRIAQLDSGLGFAYGRSDVDTARLQAWFNKLSIGEKNALRNRRGVITITGRSSGPGRPSFNARLAERRANALADALRDNFGARCRIRIQTRVEAPSRRDDARARAATIRFETAPGLDSMARIVRPKVGSIDAAPIHIGGLPKTERAELEANLRRGFTHPKVGRYFVLQNPHDATLRAIREDKVPEGPSRANGFFLWAKGRAVAVQPEYPRTVDGARAQARLNSGGPIDKRTARQLIGANKWLNERLWAHLKAGKTMEAAVKAMHRDAERQLVKTMLLMTGLGL